MAFDAPWMIGGGVAHEVEVARMLAYAASGGTEGIVSIDDLKVRPLATPGTKVRVAPGAGIMLNKFPGGVGQSYMARLPIQEEVSITATGSSGARSDLIVARITDFQYVGQQPADIQNFDYAHIEVIEGVPKRQYPLPLNYAYPAIPLARIDLPANTGTVQDEHIVDMRSVAQPRKDRQLFTYNLDSGDTGDGFYLTDPEGMTWPVMAEGLWLADVPYWATHANIVATWGGVRMKRSSAHGRIWVRLGGGGGPGTKSVRTQWQMWNADRSGIDGEETRETWTTADSVKIPASHRGTAQPLRMMGNKLQSGGSPAVDRRTSILVDIEFIESAA